MGRGYAEPCNWIIIALADMYKLLMTEFIELLVPYLSTSTRCFIKADELIEVLLCFMGFCN
jgi:hypothetical protein